MPVWRLMSRSSARMLCVVSGSSAEVASSLSRTSALLLAPADLARVTICEIAQAHERQQAGNLCTNLCRGNAGDLKRQRDVAVHSAARQQIEPLEHHADAAPLRPECGFAQMGQQLSANQDLARIRALQKVDALHQGAFASAARANHAEDLALAYVQADPAQRLEHPARCRVGLTQITDFDH